MAYPKAVVVSWTDPNPAGTVTEYRVSRDGAALGVVTTTTLADQIASPGTYTYDVVAANPQETSAPASGVFVALPGLQMVLNVTIAVG